MTRTIDQAELRNRLAVVPTGGDSDYDVFVRTYDRKIEHYWIRDDVTRGPEPLGGQFDTDPIVEVTEGALHVIGRSGYTIVSWIWNDPKFGTWLGAPDVVDTLPGFCLGDPAAVHFDGLNVLATTVEGWLKRWVWTAAGGWDRKTTLRQLSAPFHPPAAISYRQGILDVFTVGRDGDLVNWTRDADAHWTSQSLGGTGLVGQPAVASPAPGEIDIFVLNGEGVPMHWAFNKDRWFKNEHRLEMGGRVGVDVQLLTWGATRLALFVHTADGKMVYSFLQMQQGWDGPNDPFDTSDGAVAALRNGHDIDLLTRTPAGGIGHDFFDEDPSAGMGEPVAGNWASELYELHDPDPPPVGLSLPEPIEPDLLLTRTGDLVLLGLRWNGFDVQLGADGGPELHPDGDLPTLTLYFPPQHVAEQVLDDLFVPPGGHATDAAAALGGASRVVVEIIDGAPIPLTVDGVLDAMRRGRLLPSQGLTDDRTAIELPYRLIMSPDVADGHIHCHHANTELTSPEGSIGLWQTSIRADGADATAKAGLTMRPLAADSADPFAMALNGGKRARLLLEQPTARIDRLALTAIGGSLSAAGSWPNFSWEQEAVLGRDRRVRIAIQGVMYPFGHRAEYVELTERVFTSSAEGAVAFLQKTRTLRIAEPLRQEPDDAGLRAAFPFAEVEFTTTVFDHLDNPDARPPDHPGDWAQTTLTTPERDELEFARDRLASEAKERYEAIYGDMGPGGDTPPVEDLAANQTPDGPLPLDPDDPASITRAQAAENYLDDVARTRHVDAQIAALPFGGVAPLDVYFVPKRDGSPIAFPIRLAGSLGDVHVAMPLIFVAEYDREPGILTSEYHSLTDPDIAARLAVSHHGLLGDEVDVGGARIDFVRASIQMATDVHEVRRLHVVGTPADGRFRPRLGTAPAPGEQKPAEDRWAFDTVLPSLRTLLGSDQGPVRLALTPELLQSAPDLKVPFRMPDGVAPLATTFAQNTSRSGGMAAPDVVIDGISRMHGPVSVDGVLSAVDATGALDPRKVLGSAATLLGYSLADLIDENALMGPPEMLTVSAEGMAPHAELRWRDVKLTSHEAFVVGPDAKLDLLVVMGTAEQTTTCTVNDFTLALPNPENKLVEISMSKIQFSQSGSAAPTLVTTGVGVEFFGVLKLLEKLGGAMKLGDAAPNLDVSPKGLSASYALPIPDVTTGAFAMTGLLLHAGIEVPFDGRPVTIALGIASREKPFTLSVLVFGGGGYVDVLIDAGGLRRLEIALEFGASVAVDFVVASGEVHALGGVRLIKNGDDFAWDAYLRFGGSVSVLGLVSVSMELCLTLTYETRDDGTSRLVGRATLVLEIDLTLFSESVELDSGEWEIAGGGSHAAVGGGGAVPHFLAAAPGPERADPAVEQWLRYRSAFAKGSVP